MTDLDKLIVAVEAGDESAMIAVNRRMASAARDVCKYWESNDTAKAFGGSLDAAKRLHDALLPGWGWDVLSVSEAVVHESVAGFRMRAILAESDNPARAWLLSILKALKAKGKA